MKAAHYRAVNKTEDYINCVDTLIITLLKNEREPVKKLKKTLISKKKYGLQQNMGLYDELLEYIVDILEDAGYLTKEFIVEATTVELEPEGF